MSDREPERLMEEAADERVRDYIRSRTNVEIPAHLLAAVMRDIRQRQSGAGLRSWPVAAAVSGMSVVVLLAVLAVLALSLPAAPGPAGPTVSTSPPAEGSPRASVAPTTSSAPAPTELRWSVDAFLPRSGASPGAIAQVGDRLIVTGSDWDGPSAWYSDDGGATWQRATITVRGEDRRPAALGRVAGGADRLLSLGWVNVGANDADRQSLLWTSTDRGSNWERIPDDTVPPRLHDVAVGGPGFVAVGDANPSNGGFQDPAPPNAAIWLSADGQSWQRLPDDDGSFQMASMNAITGKDGLLVAVGSRRVGEDDVPAIWHSPEGRRWSSVDLSSSSGSIQGIVGGPNGFVAVGISGQRATAWLSPNGSTWVQETLDQMAGGVATRVAMNRLGFVAIGTPIGVEDIRGLVWHVPVGGAAAKQGVEADLYDLVGTGDRFIGVAGCGPTADCAPFLVIGRPIQPEASPTLTSPTPVASPSPSPDASTPLVPGTRGWIGPERISSEYFSFVRLVIDGGGFAQVVAAARDGIFYLTNESGIWTSVRLTSAVGDGYDGEPSIVIQEDGSLAIAFTRFARLRCTLGCTPVGSEGIFLLRRQSGSWSEPVLIVGGKSQEPVLSSADGRLHLAYSRGGFADRSIDYAYQADEAWTVIDVAKGRAPDLRIGRDGLARLSFVDSDGVLYYAAQTGTGSFAVERVPGNWNASSPLLALDIADEPEIVFFNDPPQFDDPACGALYVRRTAGSWSGGSRLFADCLIIAESIDRDRDGALHVISLYDESDEGSWYATNADGSFRTLHIREPVVYADDGPPSGSALALDSDGRPHILFTVNEAGFYEIDEGELPPDTDGLYYAIGPPN